MKVEGGLEKSNSPWSLLKYRPRLIRYSVPGLENLLLNSGLLPGWSAVVLLFFWSLLHLLQGRQTGVRLLLLLTLLLLWAAAVGGEHPGLWVLQTHSQHGEAETAPHRHTNSFKDTNTREVCSQRPSHAGIWHVNFPLVLLLWGLINNLLAHFRHLLVRSVDKAPLQLIITV